MRYRVRYFTPREFVCHHCGSGHASAMLVFILDTLRSVWGAPIVVNSGYRCDVHNKEVGGSPNSRHLLGCAADIAPTDMALISPFQNLVSEFVKGLSGFELRMYPRFVHLGVPRDEAGYLWLGNDIIVKAA